MQIVARGTERFEIVEWLDDAPYPRADVRALPDLEWNDALTLLGRAPEVTWDDDPFLTAETDRGDFGPGQSTGTAGTAAARLVTALADSSVLMLTVAAVAQLSGTSYR